MERGATVLLGRREVLVGSCSWTDKTLVSDADWYPRKTMSAEERLRFYASRFPLAEIDATYYAPPSARQAALWAQRTPDGFRFDVKAYSLLTGHPTRPQSLWKDLREQLAPELGEKRNVYASHLPSDLLDEAWRRFGEALAPLRESGRLGFVLFQYPPWFGPRRSSREELEALPARLPDYKIGVEFRSPAWVASDRDRERTLSLLEQLGLVFVGVDAPAVSGLPRLFAVTNPELFVARFHGRSERTWNDTSGSAAERFRYLYRKRELAELAGQVAELVPEAAETHLLMNNCYRDYSVRNAAQMRDLLSGYAHDRSG